MPAQGSPTSTGYGSCLLSALLPVCWHLLCAQAPQRLRSPGTCSSICLECSSAFLMVGSFSCLQSEMSPLMSERPFPEHNIWRDSPLSHSFSVSSSVYLWDLRWAESSLLTLESSLLFSLGRHHEDRLLRRAHSQPYLQPTLVRYICAPLMQAE